MNIFINILRRIRVLIYGDYVASLGSSVPQMSPSDEIAAFDFDGTLQSLELSYPSAEKLRAPVDIISGIAKEKR